ncbi:hypothetical protein [Nannocystis bainbridge]|uniref:Uncharacterized protein n=1 Tax=Nannocystis bainbridge TaxID=2995303 RepID=A0ABT5ECZ3_9BACT|nr:hypothetical protein [Nannocystis bainbridge]MDC0723742.1 hypothetical protein [Nannocystis bainbridge]
MNPESPVGGNMSRTSSAVPANQRHSQRYEMVSFWTWFLYGRSSTSGLGVLRIPPGYQRVVDRWLLLHVANGLIVAGFVDVPLADAAKTVLLPLAGVFVGVSFAWGANANSLLQSPENEEMARRRGGIEEYAYTFQLAMLVILSSLVLWGLAGLEVFDRTWSTDVDAAAYRAVEFVFYTTVSLTLRESWHVALGAQMLLLTRVYIRGNKESLSPREGEIADEAKSSDAMAGEQSKLS